LSQSQIQLEPCGNEAAPRLLTIAAGIQRPSVDRLEAATDHAIAACAGDARDAEGSRPT